MATTGTDLYKFLKDALDQQYTGYLNSARANRLIRDIEIKVAEKMYSNNRTQKQADELSPLTLLDQTIPVRNNTFRAKPLTFTLVIHLSGTTFFRTETPHQLQAGDTVVISGVEGFSGILNTERTVAAITSDFDFSCITGSTPGSWVVGTGNATSDYMLPKMLHPLAIQTTFKENKTLFLKNVTVSANPHISFELQSHVRTGSQIRISDAFGVTGLNADFYCKERNRTSYFIYEDALFTTPATLSGIYQGNGKANVIVKEYATRLHSDRRIAPSSKGDAWAPRFGIDLNAITLFPSDEICESVKVDYMQDPQITIDVSNDALDLEQYYDFKYLMKIKDECSASFMLEMRELQQTQAEMAVNATNP